ncbi:alpha/beta fold hydrolase [Pseudooceanicola sediminis]|uniref:Alpha/beta fold hydrolase n=1 Tax=Pseudooceanicola sediminis TaxID=2211117 RepID=A0A399J256_9RHOB|nr:alpha/beta fold hydrolase [Pseudooceanicola sediminis]RII37982.1 alpha/beta fold hydrolase [Pseudooceanicola sediminis]|tara:strand:- start:8179 stop:8895 length:717 start_codon:yes stop_codon:yes gene_type:complete
MAAFLLIHGSCHGAWCWRDLIRELEQAGHRARAIDLPGRAADARPVRDMTLDLYAQDIVSQIADEPVHLLGHSAGGFAIAAAAELAPTKIARLYYLCAYAPRDGLSMIDMRREQPRQPLLGAVRKSSDGLSYSADPAQAVPLFYHDVASTTAHWATERLCPEPIRPQATPITLGAAYASVPRCYIRCTDDRTIPPEYQAQMAATFAPEDRYEMPTSHSPFLSDPAGLAVLLTQIAGAN